MDGIVTLYTYDEIPDEKLKYAVIVARYNGKWIFCRHKNRTTWEIPGGHREPGEKIEETAYRELMEETGAQDFDIGVVCACQEQDCKQLCKRIVYTFYVQSLRFLKPNGA